jgi:hypothetical protein
VASVNELDQARAAALANARERDDLLEELDGKRAIVEDAMHQRDQARGEVERLRAKLAMPCGSCHPCTEWAAETWKQAATLPTVHDWNDLRAEVERLRAERAGWEPLTASLTRSLDVERAKVARLRGLVAEALALAVRNMRHISEPPTGVIWAEPPDPAALARSREDMAELLRIRREAD